MARRNSFDIIRLLAALAVAFGHQMDLTGRPEPTLGPLGISLSNTGLFVFFALTGCLVWKSLERDPQPRRFISARLRRLYPATPAHAVACVLLGAAVTTLAQADYWRSPQTWSYLLHGLAIVATPTEFNLPGVFADARWPNVNTPIWTLKYELLCYAAALGLHRILVPRLGAPLVLGVVTLALMAGTAWQFATVPLPDGETFYARYNGFNLLRFGMVFGYGALVAAMEGQGGWLLAARLAPVALVVLTQEPALHRVGSILLVALLVLEVGQTSLLFSRTYRSVGDLSYGVYLYSYPVQCLLATRYSNGDDFWTTAAESLAIVLLCAAGSCRLVERQWLFSKWF